MRKLELAQHHCCIPPAPEESSISKLWVCGFILLFLLIPLVSIRTVIDERKTSNKATQQKNIEQWGLPQKVFGPVLTLPIRQTRIVEKDGKQTREMLNRTLTILPEKLNIQGIIIPETRSSDIGQAVLYKAELKLTGVFLLPRDDHKNTEYGKEATLYLGLRDAMRVTARQISWNGKITKDIPGTPKSAPFTSGFQACNLPVSIESTTPIPFEITLNINGSNNILFYPVGRKNETTIKSTWNFPEFTGNFLPCSRSIPGNGFEASWKLEELNRGYPQYWIDSPYLDNSTYGVKLVHSVNLDDLRNSLFWLTVLLCFLIITFFMFAEKITQKKVHPLQYLLAGFTAFLFYMLWLSLGEHIDLNYAYWIAALGAGILIWSYATMIFRNMRTGLIMGGVTLGVFIFYFLILKPKDCVFVSVSIVFFCLLILMMKLTGRINQME